MHDVEALQPFIFPPGSKEAKNILSKAKWKYVEAAQGAHHISPWLWSRLEVFMLPMGSLLCTPKEGDEDYARYASDSCLHPSTAGPSTSHAMITTHGFLKILPPKA